MTVSGNAFPFTECAVALRTIPPNARPDGADPTTGSTNGFGDFTVAGTADNVVVGYTRAPVGANDNLMGVVLGSATFDMDPVPGVAAPEEVIV